jgi:hypothetical protein
MAITKPFTGWSIESPRKAHDGLESHALASWIIVFGISFRIGEGTRPKRALIASHFAGTTAHGGISLCLAEAKVPTNALQFFYGSFVADGP